MESLSAFEPERHEDNAKDHAGDNDGDHDDDNEDGNDAVCDHTGWMNGREGWMDG